MRIAILLLFWPAMLVAGQDGSDASAVKGVWFFDSVNGSREQPGLIGWIWDFQDGKYQIRTKDGNVLKYRYRLIPDTDPKGFDVTIDREGVKSLLKGIYRIEGKQLIRCYAQPGDPRPTRFRSGGGNTLIILTR